MEGSRVLAVGRWLSEADNPHLSQYRLVLNRSDRRLWPEVRGQPKGDAQPSMMRVNWAFRLPMKHRPRWALITQAPPPGGTA